MQGLWRALTVAMFVDGTVTVAMFVEGTVAGFVEGTVTVAGFVEGTVTVAMFVEGTVTVAGFVEGTVGGNTVSMKHNFGRFSSRTSNAWPLNRLIPGRKWTYGLVSTAVDRLCCYN